MEEKKPKKIEIVTGKGDDLNISPVYDHIDIEKPKDEKEKKKVVIPKEKKKWALFFAVLISPKLLVFIPFISKYVYYILYSNFPLKTNAYALEPQVGAKLTLDWVIVIDVSEGTKLYK